MPRGMQPRADTGGISSCRQEVASGDCLRPDPEDTGGLGGTGCRVLILLLLSSKWEQHLGITVMLGLCRKSQPLLHKSSACRPPPTSTHCVGSPPERTQLIQAVPEYHMFTPRHSDPPLCAIAQLWSKGMWHWGETIGSE